MMRALETKTGDATPMKGPLVWVLLGGIGLAAVIDQVVAVKMGLGTDPSALAFLAFPIVGALIVSHQARNAIGWIMLGIGLTMVLSTALRTYAYYALTVKPGSLPGPEFALALNAPMWVPVIGPSATFLILLFPDGRLPSARWRPWAYFSAVALILSYAMILIIPGSVAEAGYPEVRNPLGIDALEPVVGVMVSVVVLIPIAIVGCAVALIRRFRRSHGPERVQLKWLAAAAGLVAAAYLVLMALHFGFGDPDPRWLGVVSDIGISTFVLIPVAVGVAILRHRLYDIDVIINRTLVYGALTATLTSAYFILVTAMQALLRPLAGQSELAVAGSTLVVAAIFRPARRGIQTLVDHRFYRSKFDAETTLREFSARLRDEVDLETLAAQLLTVVDWTMKPASSSLWLRAPIAGGDRRGRGRAPGPASPESRLRRR